MQFRKEWVPNEGSIEIGGRKINNFSTDCNLYRDLELRCMIGVISEDNFFINGTLKDNIAWNVPNFD